MGEIRQMSGAMIRISKSDDPDASPTTERNIQITGNPDSVALAKSLINMSLDLHKAHLERGGANDDDHEDQHHDRRDYRNERRNRYDDHQPDLGLASLLAKPDVLAAVNLIGQLGNLGAGMGVVWEA